MRPLKRQIAPFRSVKICDNDTHCRLKDLPTPYVEKLANLCSGTTLKCMAPHAQTMRQVFRAALHSRCLEKWYCMKKSSIVMTTFLPSCLLIRIQEQHSEKHQRRCWCCRGGDVFSCSLENVMVKYASARDKDCPWLGFLQQGVRCTGHGVKECNAFFLMETLLFLGV